ncbi:MAG: 2-dehydropantoate 2-reductase [Spirochaetia bacterium]|nr:2-dehydropantoate 2-reductase [Spirochaetia bacterium]
MTIAIIGAGAAGSLFAAYLSKAGYNVLLTDNDKSKLKTIKDIGITILSPSGIPILHSRPDAVPSPRDCREADFFLFCVKSYSTLKAAEAVSGYAGKNSIAVTFQNGAGNDEAISRFFGRERTAAGTTTEGAFSIEPSRIAHGGKGETIIGMLENSIEQKNKLIPLIEALNKSGFKTDYTDAPKELIWRKLAVNAAINPLTAITGCKNRFTAENQHLLNIIRMTGKEVCAASSFEGIKLEEESVYCSVLNVAKNTAENKSSMLQDILSGRKTEIDYINGYIGEILENNQASGNSSQSNMPEVSVSRTLQLIVKALESKNN